MFRQQCVLDPRLASSVATLEKMGGVIHNNQRHASEVGPKEDRWCSRELRVLNPRLSSYDALTCIDKIAVDVHVTTRGTQVRWIQRTGGVEAPKYTQSKASSLVTRRSVASCIATRMQRCLICLHSATQSSSIIQCTSTHHLPT